MVIKIVILFLVAMGVLAMFGKLTLPGIGRVDTRRLKGGKTRKCRHCGAYMIGRGPCPCGKSKE